MIFYFSQNCGHAVWNEAFLFRSSVLFAGGCETILCKQNVSRETKVIKSWRSKIKQLTIKNKALGVKRQKGISLVRRGGVNADVKKRKIGQK